MQLTFSKMHGLGNDFVVFDATSQPVALSTDQVRFLADRRFGVGCDQILLVEAARDSETDFYYRIFNADGSEVEQCGNGACAAMVAGCVRGLLDEKVSVQLPGGELVVSWKAEGEPVWMTGPATEVFEGNIKL